MVRHYFKLKGHVKKDWWKSMKVNSKKLMLWKYTLRRIKQDPNWLSFILYMEKCIPNKISWWTVVAKKTVATIKIQRKYIVEMMMNVPCNFFGLSYLTRLMIMFVLLLSSIFFHKIHSRSIPLKWWYYMVLKNYEKNSWSRIRVSLPRK